MAMPTAGKSCNNCIFRMTETEQHTALRQTIGAPLCGVGHGPTMVPTASTKQNDDIEAAKAERCGDFHSVAGPTSPGELVALDRKKKPRAHAIVMLPDPTTLEKMSASRPEDARAIRSCLQCANFVPPETALENGLWNVGLCAARGIMIPNVEVTNAASHCTSKRVGMRDSSAIQRMQFTPEYQVGMHIGTVPEGGFVKDETVEVIEPTTYETDHPVNEKQRAKGIRAFRKIEDPESDNSVYLPIYDPNFFDEADRALIPKTGDDEHPEQYVDHQGLVYKCAVLWMHLDETPALWGVAGTGKTEFYRHMAWLMCLPFNRISVTASTEVEDLAGKMHYEPTRGTYFEYGRIPKAWGKPGIICLDEPNVGPPDVWQFIRPLTDNSKQLSLDMNNGERVPRHDSAFLGLAMNPAWDVRNVGTGTLADADGSRLMHIFVDLPDEKVERRIIKERCKVDDYDIPAEYLDAVIKIGKELRAMCANDTLPITWGIRPQIKVARALKWFSFSAAYRLATADYLEPEQTALILDVVKANAITKPKTRGTAVRKPEVGTAPATVRGTHVGSGSWGGAGGF